MPPENGLAIAVFGAGRMGSVHAENVAQRSGATLAGVADIDTVAAHRLVERLGQGRVDTVAGFLNDPTVDAVVIATPTATHAPLIEATATAKKHVFCEKPISLDVGTTIAAIDVCRRTGTILQIGFQRRYDRDFLRAHDAIEAGSLGQVRFLRLVSRDRAPPAIAYVYASGGQYRDQMVHDFDAARWLLAPAIAEEVTAMGTALADSEIARAGDIDTGVAVLRFSNGAIAVLDVSREAIYGYDVRTEIHGSRGMLLLGDEGIKRGSILGASLSKPDSASFITRFAAAYRSEIEDFVDVVTQGNQPRVVGDDALQALRIAIAAERSRTSGCTVRLADVEGG